MAWTRDIRRAALQALYQLDARDFDSQTWADVRASLEGSPGEADTHNKAFELAKAAWSKHVEIDALVLANTPEWPTHRQPAVDRNILRLAIFEMLHSDTPPKVAINEAVELAREFSTERSPMFVNGVLDKIYKQEIRDAPATDDDTVPVATTENLVNMDDTNPEEESIK